MTDIIVHFIYKNYKVTFNWLTGNLVLLTKYMQLIIKINIKLEKFIVAD